MTKTNKKVTKKDMFKAMLAYEGKVADREDFVKFIEHEIELLERKNVGNRKPTANQLKNEEIKTVILEEMRANPNKLYTATQLAKIAEPIVNINPLSNQRVSAILRSMNEEDGTGEVKRVVDKRVAYFQLA